MEYKPNYVAESGYDVPILGDQDKAHDLANLEDAKKDAINRRGEGNSNTFAAAVLDGRAEDLEKKWHKEDELAGLTPVEKANMDILKGLTMKEGRGAINTHAFIDKVDGKGRVYRILHPAVENFPGFMVFFCKDGTFGVTTRGIEERGDKIADKIVWEGLGNVLDSEVKQSEVDFGRFEVNLKVLSNAGTEAVITSTVDKFCFRDRNDVERLRAAIEASEKYGVAELDREKVKVPNAADILKNLV